jgi:hypothetical protein
MAQESYYRQCTLTREEGTAIHQLVTWIPEKGNGITLVEGCTLLLAQHGKKDFGPHRWTVGKLGEQRREESRVRERAHNWQKYRAATDI